tara:strand:+ start:423 stop:692 length:270 start_codon:yes stop_codon:yes gene_type:complete
MKDTNKIKLAIQKKEAQLDLNISIEVLKFQANYLISRIKVIEEDSELITDTVLKYSGMAGRYAAVTRGLGEELLSVVKKLEKISKVCGY